MQRRYLPALVGAYTALAVLGVCQASAATLETVVPSAAFQAIYGNPPSTTEPIGLGLGRNFGFGANLLFHGDTKAKIGSNITTEFNAVSFTANDVYVGGSLMSDKTGENIPLGLSIQFVDFNNVIQTIEGVKEPVQKFSDTNDRPWITDICPPAAKLCELDPQFLNSERSVEIQDVAFDFGAKLVAQGTMWGKWVNGTKTTPPCIVFELPFKNTEPTLIVTQTAGGPYPPVGTTLKGVKGEICLIIANNYYYEGNTPEVIIKNI